MKEKPKSFQDLLEDLKKRGSITVDTGRTLFYENREYYEQTPEGKKPISPEEAQGYLRIMVARGRRERREQRKQEEKTQ